MSPNRTRNQDWLCWQGPAAITKPDPTQDCCELSAHREVMTRNSQTPPLIKEEAPVQNTEKYGKNENTAIGPETKIDSAGEGQRQFTWLTDQDHC